MRVRLHASPRPRGRVDVRAQLAVIYLFLYCLLAPLVGKLVSLCRAAGDSLHAGHATGLPIVSARKKKMATTCAPRMPMVMRRA